MTTDPHSRDDGARGTASVGRAGPSPIYALAEFVHEPKVARYGLHQTKGGWPAGCVIHYTADGTGLDGTLSSLVKDGYGYHLIIDREGQVFQLASVQERLAHAGHSRPWNGLMPSRTFCGVALDLWGELHQRMNGRLWAWPQDWTKVEIAREHANHGPDVKGRMAWWEAASEKQVAALTDACLWLKGLGVPPANFVGHDEVSLSGKVDPGFSLGFSMGQFRDFLARAG